MKNKHPHAAVVLVLGLAMAGLHLADLLLWSEADTGFAAAGSVWLRYIPWLAAFALPYLPARRAAAQPAGLQDTNKPLGVCMALAGAVLLASGVAAGNTARYAILYPEVLSGSYPVWAAWADLLLPIFAGAWLLNYAVRAFSGFGLQRQRLGSSLLAGAVPLVFLWRLIWRFQFAPASLCRMACTLRVLSAAAALLLAVVLIKIFLVPGLPCGHTLYAAGAGAFLLCTGLELPQTLFEAARGMLTLPDLLTPDESGNIPLFHAYYLTFSGHMYYNFTSNDMAIKNKAVSEGLPYSTATRAYISCQEELEYALETMNKMLADAGVADKTLIVLTADHYPYNLGLGKLSELAGKTLEAPADKYRSALYIWSPSMTAPVTVDAPCSTLDVLPTVSNLLGLPYDSRLLSGRDILAEGEHIAILGDRSFVTETIYYDAESGTATPRTDAPVDAAAVERLNTYVKNKFTVATEMLYTDYFAKVRDRTAAD